MLNIPSSVDDPSYRYKMPRIISRKEGRGNGSKTGILNMGDVARALKRDPVYITKFLGYDLGAQSSYTNKENEGERVVINGHHETHVFQDLVDKFIQKYVLCVGCNLPEIDMIVKKGIIVAQCKACGWAGELDNQHKLAGYISKNPPGTGIGFDGEGGGGKKSREERQRERAEKAKKKQDKGDDADDDSYVDDGDEKEKKEKKEKKDKKEKKEKKKKSADDDDDDDVERKEKKEKKDKKDKKDKKEKKKDKKDKKEKKSKKASKDDDDDGSDAESKGSGSDDGNQVTYGDEDVKIVIKDIADLVKSNGTKLTIDLLFEEVRAQQVRLEFDDRLRLFVVLAALFPEGSMDAEAVVSRKSFVKYFVTNGKLSFADMMWSIEAYLDTYPKALKGYPMTLKALYDQDMAEEKELLAYYNGDQDSPGFEEAKKSCAPFIKWLEQEDESGSDDSDEDSD